MSYHDDDEDNDPGTLLREELSHIELPEINETALANLLYTADERGLMVGIDGDDLEVLRKILILADTISTEDLERLTM